MSTLVYGSQHLLESPLSSVPSGSTVLNLDLGVHCHGRVGENQEPRGCKNHLTGDKFFKTINTSLICKPRECSRVSTGAEILLRMQMVSNTLTSAGNSVFLARNPRFTVFFWLPKRVNRDISCIATKVRKWLNFLNCNKRLEYISSFLCFLCFFYLFTFFIPSLVSFFSSLFFSLSFSSLFFSLPFSSLFFSLSFPSFHFLLFCFFWLLNFFWLGAALPKYTEFPGLEVSNVML